MKDNRNIYFFSNSSDKLVDTKVKVRGSLDLSIWNPMNGEISTAEEIHTKNDDGIELTEIQLKLEPTTALFFVEDK